MKACAAVARFAREPLRAALVIGLSVLAALTLLKLVDGAWRAEILRLERERAFAEVASVLDVAGKGGEGRIVRLDDPARMSAFLDLDPLAQVYALSAGTQTLAVAVVFTAREGYGGPFRLVVGVDSGLRITGVRVLEHVETPGIGSFIGKPADAWMRSLAGAGPAEVPVDAVAGATVTSEALVSAVEAVLAAASVHAGPWKTE